MRKNRVLPMVAFLVMISFGQGCKKKAQPLVTLSPLPTFESAVATPAQSPSVAAPSPVPGMAVVVGEIIDVQTQQAPLEGTLYLGSIVSLDNGKPVVRLDRETAPSAVPTQGGRFSFQEIEPGRYGLVLYTPEISFLIDDPESGKSLTFTVKPDQILDLGKIEVSMP